MAITCRDVRPGNFISIDVRPGNFISRDLIPDHFNRSDLIRELVFCSINQPKILIKEMSVSNRALFTETF